MKSQPNILIAGIGNLFFGDDAFGVRVAQQLLAGSPPIAATVRDFGIRSFDLAAAMCEPYDLIILLDASARGDAPGTLRLIEPTLNSPSIVATGIPEMHRLDPVAAIALAQRMGANLPAMRLLACEPMTLEGIGLSVPVQAAVAEAIQWLHQMVFDAREQRNIACTNSA